MLKLTNLFGAIVFAFSLILSSAAIAQQGMGGGGGGGAPDLSAAVEALGVTEQELQEALGQERPPNFAAAAEKLGITEEELVEALPPPRGGDRPQQ